MPDVSKTRIDQTSEARQAAVDLLNARLADAIDLYTQTKQAHWTVSGTDFIQLHELFDQLATTMIVHYDDMAERVMTLGGKARGTARMAAGSSTLPEYPTDLTGGVAHVEALADRYAKLGNAIRESRKEAEKLDDLGTADLLAGIALAIDKDLWFLEAHLG